MDWYRKFKITIAENMDDESDYSNPQDTAYFEAVKNEKMVDVQRMVEEAAMSAGYNIGPVYHGTSNPEFNRFTERGGLTGRLGFWFTSNKSSAQNFARQRFHDIKPGVKSVYLKLHNTITYKGWDKITEAVSSMRNGGSIEQGAEKLRGSLMRKGFDGIIIVGSDTDNAGIRDDYVVFKSNQIKSADLVVYDNSKNVIPLSRRFDPGNDIRGTV